MFDFVNGRIITSNHPYWLWMKSLAHKILLFVHDSEMLRLFALIALTIYAYHPFFSASNIGGADAQYYQYILHDAIIQLENGFFPTYVGQSLFLPNGTKIIVAPYYLLLGQLLNTLSFGALNPLLVQHLTIFASALSAALVMYIAIRNVAPLLRWQAVFLASAYISSPGVMSLIFNMDMYFSFMAIPFVPVVFYGLARIYQKDDALAYVLTGSALALVWLSHAPIALWVSFLSLVFCLLLIVLTRRNPAKFVALALLFALLCLWQFLPIFSLGLNPGSGVQIWSASVLKSRVDQVIEQLLQPIPDVFLPLSQGKNGLYFLQLGYSLWFVIILATLAALRSSGTLLIRLMLTLITIILLFLYPLPGIGRFLWSNAPALVLDITNIFPNQRLYVILAAAGCFVGALALQKISGSERHKIKGMLAITLTGLFVWNIYQISFFIKHGNAARSSNESISDPKDSWGSSNNMQFVGFGLPKEYLQSLFTGSHASQLKSRLLDSQKNPISAYDNEQYVINLCLGSTTTKNEASLNDKISLPFEATLKEPLSIAKLNLHPNFHYLLCADMSTSHGYALFQLLDTQRREKASLEVPYTVTGAPVRQKIGIPFYFTDQKNKGMTDSLFDFRVWSREQPLVKLYNVGVTSYEPANLPIVIESYTPYSAKVITKPEHKYIEIIKLFTPGYAARVNGEETPIIESERKTIIIPLKSSGSNKIELAYVGTPGMRTSFYISAVSWCLVIVFLVAKLILHMKRRWKLRQEKNQW